MPHPNQSFSHRSNFIREYCQAEISHLPHLALHSVPSLLLRDFVCGQTLLCKRPRNPHSVLHTLFENQKCDLTIRPFSNGSCSRLDLKGPETLYLLLPDAAGNF